MYIQNHGLPAQVPDAGTVNSSVINTQGLNNGVVALTSDHAGTLSVQRYADAGGQVPVGAAITDATAPLVCSWNDGLVIGSIKVSFVNSAGAVANLTNITVNLHA